MPVCSTEGGLEAVAQEKEARDANAVRPALFKVRRLVPVPGPPAAARRPGLHCRTCAPNRAPPARRPSPHAATLSSARRGSRTPRNTLGTCWRCAAHGPCLCLRSGRALPSPLGVGVCRRVRRLTFLPSPGR